MGRMLSTEFEEGIKKAAFQHWLLRLARNVLLHSFNSQQAFDPHSLIIPKAYQAMLAQQACCFVTLHTPVKANKEQKMELRGCIGSLTAQQPLLADLVMHAYAAGFNDRRFLPLQEYEMAGLKIEISILTEAQEMECENETQLLLQLRPYEDGLILQDHQHKATFLPSVWQQLPDKQDFVCHLKVKAGLSPNEWPSTMKAFRYQTISFHDE
jgi:AmmeMemoRadiSam system protein A